MKHEKLEILLCDKCNGKGVVHREELIDYHKGDYNYWTEECPRCKCSGLIQKHIVTETTITPYFPPKPTREILRGD